MYNLLFTKQYMETFGEVIYHYRNEKGYTLRKFAELIGKSPSFISLLENNKNISSASEETITEMARVLSLPADKLLNLAMKVPEKDLIDLKGVALAFFREEK